MKIAYLLLVHTNPDQVNRQINALNNGKNHFFIHIDQKSDIRKDIVTNEFVHFVENPYSVKWGDFTLVEATIALCKLAYSHSANLDYFILLSGQDYPVKSNREIEEFLTRNKGKQYFKVRELPYEEWGHHSGGFDRLEVYFPKAFIDRSRRTWWMRTQWINFSRKLRLTRKIDFFEKFYGVSQWFVASREAMEYIVQFIDVNPKTLKFFKNTFIPDEILFNTIIMNSPFREDVVANDQRLVVWTNTSENPKVWRVGDIDELMETEYLFARKFDIRKDSEIFDRLDEIRSKADVIS